MDFQSSFPRYRSNRSIIITNFQSWKQARWEIMYDSKKSILEEDLSLLKSFEKLQSAYRKLLVKSKAFSTIIELRDKERLNWNQIARLLEEMGIKTMRGGQRWKGRNVARIYRREKIKSGKSQLSNYQL